MKKVLSIVLLFVFLLPSLSFAARVRAYYRDSDGDGIKERRVESYERSRPNSSTRDNYGSPGNYNQNTGTYNPEK